MRVFTKKQNRLKERTFLSSAKSMAAASPSGKQAHPMLLLQRATGNQAVQRLLEDTLAHTDHKAHQSARTVSALADTVGRDAVFGSLPGCEVAAPESPITAGVPPSSADPTEKALSVPGGYSQWNLPGSYEQQADWVAERIVQLPDPAAGIRRKYASGGSPALNGPWVDWDHALLRVERRPVDHGEHLKGPRNFHEMVDPSGQLLDVDVRSFMEPRFGYDFSHVHVHTDARAARSARQLNALAFTVGRHIVFGTGRYAPGTQQGRRLLAHELAHVVQGANQRASGTGYTPVRRKVSLNNVEMSSNEQADFIKADTWKNPALARAIMQDMADAGDSFDFFDESELRSEIGKRIATSEYMKESQAPFQAAFGYPFVKPSALYGPRVNFEAREYWEPEVGDGYAFRTDPSKNKDFREKPRDEWCTIYNDPCDLYEWTLSPKGKQDPYSAIVKLFTAQPPHKRTLLHCDYLVSLVQFRSFADSVGKEEFNMRVTQTLPWMVLRWNAFEDLDLTRVRTFMGIYNIEEPGLGSLQRTRVSSEKDLVIGDHVVFHNHPAYDVINHKVGRAWRLENAILIEKQNGRDIFLGHGSGRMTAEQMRWRLRNEYNQVYLEAAGLIGKTKSTNANERSEAEHEMREKFPYVERVSDHWNVHGKPGRTHDCDPPEVNEELRPIEESDVLGLKDPCDPKKLWWVWRPIESK